MTVEYRWHPFHGRRLHARDAGRRDGILLLVDGDPHVSRKLPDWMCNPAACGSMILSPPRVRADALSELSEALAALVRAQADLLLEALDRETAMAKPKEAIDELEDHI